MSVFRVWAPTAEQVEVQLGSEAMGGGAPQPMRPAATPGWWEADLAEAAATGTDYAFRVDGGEPLADPRSPWQPLGSEGPSRTYDHGAFRWTDRGWRGGPLRGAVIYEMHVGTFTPGGDVRRGHRAARPSLRPGRGHDRADARGRVSRPARLGL